MYLYSVELVGQWFLHICIWICICICICICASNMPVIVYCICIQSWACLFPGRPMMSSIPPLRSYAIPTTIQQSLLPVDGLSREWWPPLHMWISQMPLLQLCLYLYLKLRLNQGSTNCGAFSQQDFIQNYFLWERMFDFCDKKCRILAFRDKK